MPKHLLVTSRALSLLAAFASPVFMLGAIAAWIYGVWPATPLTLGLAAFMTVSGPLLGMWHVATADEDYEDDALEATFVATAAPREPIMTPKAASARAFHHWRDSSNPAIERRERERRASQYIRA